MVHFDFNDLVQVFIAGTFLYLIIVKYRYLSRQNR